MDYNKIIDKYYNGSKGLRRILITHSEAVALFALRVLDNHPELKADRNFVYVAAMLHDIGIIRCDAPRILCFGTEPYIRHGRIGADMLRAEGLPKYARVCERHTGTGLSERQIVEQNLPLPHQDFLPETIEEQLICYADKFFSKTHLYVERTVEQAEKSLKTHGEDGITRFKRWERLFK